MELPAAIPLLQPDPVARLRIVHARTQVRKRHHDAERREQLLEELARRSPHLRELATRLARSRRRFALSVSNVVGPRAPVELLERPGASAPQPRREAALLSAPLSP